MAVTEEEKNREKEKEREREREYEGKLSYLTLNSKSVL